MKTLEEIKEERAHEMDYSDWEEFIYGVDDPIILDMEFDEVSVRYAKEVAMESLKNASYHYDACSMAGQVNIKLILNKKNIPGL